MNYPNKIYVSEYKGENEFGGNSHFVITLVASDNETARKYVKDTIGFDAEPIWLMNAVFPTLYTSNGERPLPVQAKILSNNNFHTYEKNNTK